jgi:hypothetical protein
MFPSLSIKAGREAFSQKKKTMSIATAHNFFPMSLGPGSKDPAELLVDRGGNLLFTS